MMNLRTDMPRISMPLTDPWGVLECWKQGLEHVDTGRLASGAESPYVSQRGYTVWGNREGVQVWFEWVELSPMVVALANPMDIRVNRAFLDDSGKPTAADVVPLFLATVVHELGWQAGVCEWLRSHPRKFRHFTSGDPNANYRARGRQLLNS